jgi:hypothetical protein
VSNYEYNNFLECWPVDVDDEDDDDDDDDDDSGGGGGGGRGTIVPIYNNCVIME